MPGTRKNGRPPLHPGKPVQNRLNEEKRANNIKKLREKMKGNNVRGLRIKIPSDSNTSDIPRGNKPTPHLKRVTANNTPPPTPSPVYHASGPNSGNAPPSPPFKSRFSNGRGGGRFTRRKMKFRRA